MKLNVRYVKQNDTVETCVVWNTISLVLLL